MKDNTLLNLFFFVEKKRGKKRCIEESHSKSLISTADVKSMKLLAESQAFEEMALDAGSSSGADRSVTEHSSMLTKIENTANSLRHAFVLDICCLLGEDREERRTGRGERRGGQGQERRERGRTGAGGCLLGWGVCPPASQ